MNSMGIQLTNDGSLMVVGPIDEGLAESVLEIPRDKQTQQKDNRSNTAEIGPGNPPIQATPCLVGRAKINGWCIAHCYRFGPQCKWKVPFVKSV